MTVNVNVSQVTRRSAADAIARAERDAAKVDLVGLQALDSMPVTADVNASRGRDSREVDALVQARVAVLDGASQVGWAQADAGLRVDPTEWGRSP